MKGLIFVSCFGLCIIPGISSINLLNLTKSQKDILNDLSWNIRPAIIKSFVKHDPESASTSNAAIKWPKIKKAAFEEFVLRHNFRNGNFGGRKLGVYAQQKSIDETAASSIESDGGIAISQTNEGVFRSTDREYEKALKYEMTMKTKMFSLMYETVRDTDSKVKRAEQIKDYYKNNTDFEIGFLMGEATDKYNSMMEVAATVKRLYKEWKPLDHINAYEQIANQAIQINTVVEMILSKTRGDVIQPPNTYNQQRKHSPDGSRSRYAK